MLPTKIPRHRQWCSAKTMSRKFQFPFKLHRILEDAFNEGNEHIISWLPDGKSFKIHSKEEFEKVILPKYYDSHSPKYRSFLRQLWIYGFELVEGEPSLSSGGTRGGDHSRRGCYTHPLLSRGKPDLCTRMVRQAIKSVKVIGKERKDSDEQQQTTTVTTLTEEHDSEHNSSRHQEEALSESMLDKVLLPLLVAPVPLLGPPSIILADWEIIDEEDKNGVGELQDTVLSKARWNDDHHGQQAPLLPSMLLLYPHQQTASALLPSKKDERNSTSFLVGLLEEDELLGFAIRANDFLAKKASSGST